MSNNLDDVLGGAGGTTAFNKETPMGTKFTGTIVDATVQQIKDIRDGKPKTWDDGRPQEQIVIRIQTAERTDEEDDGIRALYIKTWGVWKSALLEAVQAGGFGKLSEALAPGNVFSDEYYADKPAPSAGLSPTKLHRYTVAKGSPVALDTAIGGSVNTSTGEISAPAPAAAVAPAPAAAAPVAAPAAAAPAPAAPDPVATAKQLIALNIPDNVIAAQTGLADVVIAALRGQSAAA